MSGVKNIKTRIQNKNDLEINWLDATNFIPLKGELIIYRKEVDNDGNPIKILKDGAVISPIPTTGAAARSFAYTYDRFKFGDGVTAVNDLPFINDAIEVTTQNNLISAGTADPSTSTTSKFYFKYS
jgi:hypothetical protein